MRVPPRRRGEPWARAPRAPGGGPQGASGRRNPTPVWLLLGVGWRGSRKVGGRPTSGTRPTKAPHGGRPAAGSLAPGLVGVSVSPASSVSPSGAKGLDFHLSPHGAFLRPGRPLPEPQFPASEDPVWEAPLQAQHMATCFHLVASWPVVEAVKVSVNFLDTRAAPPHVCASLASTGPVTLELRVCPDPNS